MDYPEEQEPTQDDHGYDTHPAFAQVTVNRVTSSHGMSMFDSEVKHNHFIELSVRQAVRKRDLQRDWIHSGREPYITIRMSEAQWAQMVSSLNTSGTPCTLTWFGNTPEAGYVPEIPFAPRLTLSMEETRRAATKAFNQIKEAYEIVQEKPNKTNLRNLKAAIDNATPNVKFAAESLARHTEDTVTKAKADIEAMVNARARQLGIDPSTVTLEIES